MTWAFFHAASSPLPSMTTGLSAQRHSNWVAGAFCAGGFCADSVGMPRSRKNRLIRTKNTRADRGRRRRFGQVMVIALVGRATSLPGLLYDNVAGWGK